MILCLKWGLIKTPNLLGPFLLDRHKEKLWETSLFYDLDAVTWKLAVSLRKRNEVFVSGVYLKSCLPYSVY